MVRVSLCYDWGIVCRSGLICFFAQRVVPQQVEGLLDGPPVLLGDQYGVGPLAGDLHRLVGFGGFVEESVEISPGFGGGDGFHGLDIWNKVRNNTDNSHKWFRRSLRQLISSKLKWEESIPLPDMYFACIFLISCGVLSIVVP